MKPETKGTMSYEDRRRFAVGVLKGIAAPVTAGNVETLLAWMSRENTAARNNPMATTFSSNGWKAHNYRTRADGSRVAHVKHYPSFKEGVRSTVLTLLGYSEGNLLSDRQVAEELGVEPRYPVVLELLRRGTEPQEIIDNPEAAKEVEKWGTFEKRIGYGAKDTWGYTREELESLAPGELEALHSEILRPIDGYEFPDPTTVFAVERREGADVEQFADIQNPAQPEETDDWTKAPEIIGGDFRDELTEHDPDRARSLAEGIESGEFVGQEAQVDAPEGGIPESWMDKELVDSSVPTPRQDQRGTGSTSSDAVFLEEIFENVHTQLSEKLAEMLGISTSGIRGQNLSEKIRERYDSVRENTDRLENAEELASQTLEIFKTKAAQHRGGKAKLSDEDRELLFDLIGTSRGGRQGSTVKGLSIATPGLEALYRNRDATYNEVLAELQKAPAHARKLAETLLADQTGVESFIELWKKFDFYTSPNGFEEMLGYEGWGTGEAEKRAIDWLRNEFSQTLISDIESASELLETNEFIDQLDNLAEPGTFDRQADWWSNEFIHAMVVDEYLSSPEVGALGPPNAPINVTPSEPPSLEDPSLEPPSLEDPSLEDPSVISEDDDSLEGLDELDDETAALIRNNLGAVSFFEQRTPDFMYDSDGDGEGDTNVIDWIIANPELSDIQVLEALRSVPWFQSTGPFSRQFQMDYFAEGPAGKDELISTQRDAILKEAKMIGFNWIEDDPELLNNLAYEASLYGWSDADRRRALAGLNTYQASEFKRGKILANRQTVLDTAAKYYIPIGESAANDLAFNIYKGDETTESLEAMYREQAKGMFPTLSGLIDQGITPKTYFSPYKEKISQLLEVSTDGVDLMNDPRFQAIMFPEAGKGPLSLYETQRYVRQLPEWQYTKNADESARRMVNNIGKIMGVVA